MTTTILILINGFLVRACYVLDTVLSTKNFTDNISRGSSQQLCGRYCNSHFTNKETKALGSYLPKGMQLGFSPRPVCVPWLRKQCILCERSEH